MTSITFSKIQRQLLHQGKKFVWNGLSLLNTVLFSCVFFFIIIIYLHPCIYFPSKFVLIFSIRSSCLGQADRPVDLPSPELLNIYL